MFKRECGFMTTPKNINKEKMETLANAAMLSIVGIIGILVLAAMITMVIVNTIGKFITIQCPIVLAAIFVILAATWWLKDITIGTIDIFKGLNEYKKAKQS